MLCKGICLRHRAQKPAVASYSRYAMGQKRCQICEIFIKWDLLWCPCCGCRMRTRSRSSKYKSNLKIPHKGKNLQRGLEVSTISIR
jgi:hypothetical protein